MPIIKRLGVPCEIATLQYGDACMEGNGKDGKVVIGVERKTLPDMLQCIDDSRYSAHQRPGMASMYAVSILMIEGIWWSDENGILMEWAGREARPCKYRSQPVMYSKLYRYLISISLSGVIITYSRNMTHTAYNIVETFHYFSKPWSGHTSLLQPQKFAIPDMREKPSLVKRWAHDLDGVGIVHADEAERMFRTGQVLGNSEESDWLKLKGIGIKTAQSIIKQIRGLR